MLARHHRDRSCAGRGGGPAEARPQDGAARRRRRGGRSRASRPRARRAAGEGPDAGSHPRVQGGLSGVPRRPGRPGPADGRHDSRQRVLRPDLELLGAQLHAPRRARPLRHRRALLSPDLARRARASARRGRHLRPRGCRSGRGGRPGRPRPVRAGSRADSARRGRRDELRLGCPLRQRRRVPERRRGRAAALPRLLARRRSSGCWRSGTSPASASTRSASTPVGRRRSTRM